jgi:GNAT superfamily N-acetyltransferase
MNAYLRSATVDDADRVLEMAIAFISDPRHPYAGLFDWTPERIKQLVDLVLERGVILVAVVEGRLEGMIAAVASPVLYSHQMAVEEIAFWVEPGERGAGIGPVLLTALEDWACSKGIHMVKLVAPDGSRTGRHYQRLGYLPIETAWVKRLN